MSDILPPMAGKAVDKILGKGSIALITDETLLALVPMRVNGVPDCIYLRQDDSRGCSNVNPSMEERHKIALLKGLAEQGTMQALTMPMCHRSSWDAWSTAGDILQALADAARLQAKAAAAQMRAEKPRHTKLKGKK